MPNNQQLNLFDKNGEAFARSRDPVTSKEAAESVRGEEATRMEGEVLQELRRWPHGLTTHELVDHTGIPYWSLTPRIRPLVRKGFVEDSGIKRAGKSGRNSIVWKAK